ncbi:MAG: potassium transporter Kef [Polyangiaceae bacterium]
MNAILLLVGLLVLAYLGSILVGGRAIRGYGLPSGSEYLILGFVLGPHVLGVVDRAVLGAMEPFLQVGLAWLALVIGVDYGFVGARRVPLSRLILGLCLSLACGLGVAAAFATYALNFTGLQGRELLIACIGVGAVSCDTTRHAVRWVVERYAARGTLSDLVADIADADDLVPLLSITFAFALAPSPNIQLEVPFWLFAVTTLGTGVLLGALSSALLRVELRTTQTWGILLGAALFGIGTAARLGKSALGLLFALGLTISILGGRRTELRRMLERTEQPVLLPVLVLAGAYVNLEGIPNPVGLVLVVLASRVATKWVAGAILRLTPSGRGAGRILGLGLLPSGALTMAFGLAFALRFPGVLGQTVLVVAALVTVFGELVGPTSLRLALARAGEIEAPASSRLRPSSRPPARPA